VCVYEFVKNEVDQLHFEVGQILFGKIFFAQNLLLKWSCKTSKWCLFSQIRKVSDKENATNMGQTR
jgi:hypothetical protein